MQCRNWGANVGIEVQRGICNEIIKLSSNTTGVSKINRPAAPDIAKGEGEQAAMSLKMSRLNFDTLIIQYNAAIRKVNQIPLCTPILTFAPQFWHLVKPLKKGQFWRPKKGKKGPKIKDISWIHIGMDFLQKTGSKLLKFGPCGAIYILQQLIWGRHPVPCLSTQISKRQGTAMY